MKPTNIARVVASLLMAHTTSAQIEGTTRTQLQQHDIDIPGHYTAQDLVDFGPGVTFPRHTHPGEEVIYVLDGLLEYTIDDQPPVVLKAGDVFFVPAGVIHAVRNLGNKNGTELGTYILQKGQPQVTFV